MTTKKFTPTVKRGPRLTPGEINVTPPDDVGVEIPASGIQKMLPWVMGGGMLGMIAIMIFTGIRQLSPYMLMMPLMMIMATVGFMAGGGPGGKRVPEINADALALVARYKMREVFGCARMVFGPIPQLPDAEIFGVTTFELG